MVVATRLRLSDDDKAAMRVYWEFFEPIAVDVNAELRASLRELPEWAPIIRMLTPEQSEKTERESRRRQREAIMEGNWAPYLEDVRAQGASYAKIGISFVAWYDVIAIYRELIRQRLSELARGDLERAQRVANGMNRLIDIAMSHLGEAYLATKEQIIAQQQEAIRELSMPILQVRDRVMIVPLVGIIDSTRARQLIEALLAAVRDRRAHGVVIDVTGIPLVDTAVANHLVQACDAASLMGTTVVITGVSPEMAQTLVSLGTKLPAVETLGDLQEGIAYIETLLGYREPTVSQPEVPEDATPDE
jgi:rsbT co-antagonist protein RsbR